MAFSGPTSLFTPLNAAAVASLSCSFTPAVGDLVFLFVGARRNAAPDQIPNFAISAQTHGGTWSWTRLQDAAGGSTGAVFMAFVPIGGDVAGTVTISPQITAGSNPLRWRLAGYKVTGIQPTIPTNVITSNADVTTTPSVALATAPLTSSLLLGMVYTAGVTKPSVTPGAGFTAAVEVGDGVSSVLEIEYRTGTTSPTFSWGGCGTSNVQIAIEIKVPAYSMPAVAGAYAWTGVAAGLAVGHKMAAAPGAYAWAGVAARLAADRKLPAAAGTYAWTGIAARLAVSRKMAAAPGAYAWAGTAAGLQRSRTLLAAPGAYAWTGVAARLAATRQLAAVPAGYSWAGVPARLAASRRLAAAPGAYAWAGSAAGLQRARTLLAAPGAYVWAGTASGLKATRRLAADPQGYLWVGSPAGLAKADLSSLVGPTTMVTPYSGSLIRVSNTPDFTPVAGDLLLVAVTARQSAAGSPMPDFSIDQTHLGTWNWVRLQIGSGVSPETVNALFMAIVPPSPGLGHLILDSNIATGSAGTRWRVMVDAWTGVPRLPTRYATGVMLGPAPFLALPLPPRLSSCIVGYLAASGVTNPSINPGVGFTEAHEVGDSVATSFEQEFKRGTSVQTLDWSGASTNPLSMIVVEIPSTTANDYALPAVTGTFVWTGLSAILATARRLAAVAQAYLWTGVAASFPSVARRLSAASSVFNWSAPPDGLRVGRRLLATTQAYVWTGVATGLTYVPHKTLFATTAAFSLAPGVVKLAVGRRLLGSSQAYSWVGGSARLVVDRRLVAVSQNYLWTPTASRLPVHHNMPAAAGTLLWAPATATLTIGRRLVATTQTYLWVGVQAGGTLPQRVIASAGSFQLLASPARLVVTRRLVASTQTFAWAGVPAGLSRLRRLAASPASFSWGLVPVQLRRGHRLVAVSQTYLLNGQNVVLITPRRLTAETANFVWSPKAVRFGRTGRLRAETATFEIQGVNITFGEPGIEMMALIEGTIRPDVNGQLQLQLFSKATGTIYVKVPTIGFLFEVD